MVKDKITPPILAPETEYTLLSDPDQTLDDMGTQHGSLVKKLPVCGLGGEGVSEEECDNEVSNVIGGKVFHFCSVLN